MVLADDESEPNYWLGYSSRPRTDQQMGRGVGLTGVGRGADTGTAAADGAGAVDTVERGPAGAGGGGCHTTQDILTGTKKARKRRNHQLQYPDICQGSRRQ
jgi:hypothetical protein